MHRAMVCLIGMCFVGLYCVHDLVWRVDHQRLNRLAVLSETGDYEQYDPVMEILRSWQLSAIKLESYAFDADIEESDPVWKKKSRSTAKIKIQMQQDGACWSRMDVYDSTGKAMESLVSKGSAFFILHNANKLIQRAEQKSRVAKKDMADFGNWLFPAIPFFCTDLEDLKTRFAISLVQQDKDYTWIRFIPKQQDAIRNYQVAQIGVINYANIVSHKDFPLKIMWREPGGKDITWSFTDVKSGQASCVSHSDFQIDVKQLRNVGWKYELLNNSGFMRWRFGLKPVPDWLQERLKVMDESRN